MFSKWQRNALAYVGPRQDPMHTLSTWEYDSLLRGPSRQKMMVLTKITENLFLGWGFSHTHYLYVSHLFSTYLSYFSRYEYLYEHIYTLHLCNNIVFWRMLSILRIQIENDCVHSNFSISTSLCHQMTGVTGLWNASSGWDRWCNPAVCLAEWPWNTG